MAMMSLHVLFAGRRRAKEEWTEHRRQFSRQRRDRSLTLQRPARRRTPDPVAGRLLDGLEARETGDYEGIGTED